MFKSNRWYKSQRNHNYNKCHDLITIITIWCRNGRAARITSRIITSHSVHRIRCAGTSLNPGYSGLTRNCRRTICLSFFFLFSFTRAILRISIDIGWILFIFFFFFLFSFFFFFLFSFFFFFLFSLTRAILQILIDSGWILFILFAKVFFLFFLCLSNRLTVYSSLWYKTQWYSY